MSQLPFKPLPLGAALLAGSLTASPAFAQTPAAAPATTLGTVEVRDQAIGTDSKTTLKATESRIGKGNQALRDIPQSVTVMTERLLDDRNLDDFREVLRTTAGVTFQAGETGEEDIRLRGFSLGQAGDIYVDGLRDAPLIERDTFNLDRVEILKGSASMLFGKGSTGGVVNQVSKQPFLMDQHEINTTIGTGRELRLTGDFNLKTGDDAALRINAMAQNADNKGAKDNKRGIAPTYRWGIGLKDEFSIGLYHLETDGNPGYNHPWFQQPLGNGKNRIIETLPADNFYGLASDYNRTTTTAATFSHTHRFDRDSELRTTVRHGEYERELWTSVIRFAGGTTIDNLNPNTVITRTPKGRVGYSTLTQVQSDYSTAFDALGMKHQLLAGIDLSDENAKRNQSFAGTASGLNTTVGTPNDGAWRADTRGEPPLTRFDARNVGLYAQNTMALTEALKLVAGLRFDRFTASYRDPAGNQFEISENLWSPRLGLLFQPSATASYYASFGTSYNTSGDTYQYALGNFAPGSANARNANTPPEKSRNFEVGAKWDLFDNRALFGVALFHSEKYNERNTDPDTAATQQLLSGKRFARGMEFNLAGRITPAWEIFYNHTWIPSARITRSNQALAASGGGAQVEGDRPGLTPEHSASLWTAYRLSPAWRIGAGLNFRSEQSPEGARNVVADSFVTLDAMAEYVINDRHTLKLNISNLTDELYADGLYRGFYQPGAARRVQVTLTTLF